MGVFMIHAYTAPTEDGLSTTATDTLQGFFNKLEQHHGLLHVEGGVT